MCIKINVLVTRVLFKKNYICFKSCLIAEKIIRTFKTLYKFLNMNCLAENVYSKWKNADNILDHILDLIKILSKFLTDIARNR